MTFADLDGLLTPIDPASPAGPDLSYDIAFVELETLARGIPDRVARSRGAGGKEVDLLIPGVPSDPHRVCAAAVALLARTKDLRVAVLLTDALTAIDGLSGLSCGLKLIARLLSDYWDTVHPLIDQDDGDDATARTNALLGLVDPELVVGTLRSTELRLVAQPADFFAARDMPDLVNVSMESLDEICQSFRERRRQPPDLVQLQRLLKRIGDHFAISAASEEQPIGAVVAGELCDPLADIVRAPVPAAVLLGASAPRRVAPGGEFTARFVAYVESAADEVGRVLEMMSPRSSHLLGLRTCHWLPGTRVKVAAYSPHMDVRPPAQEFVWIRDHMIVDFDVFVRAQAPEETAVLKFDVSIDEILVSTLRFDIDITTAAPTQRRQVAHERPARTAFASYSSEDSTRVLDRVAAVRISAGLDVFLDCLSLHPGDEWKARLAEEIRQRDLFLLFWSSQAARSDWVKWEWETALSEKGMHAMQIHPLEPGIPPPQELKALHFGDVFMLVREAKAHLSERQ